MQRIEFASSPLRLFTVEGLFAVSKLTSSVPIPQWATQGELFSITRTTDELSIICRQDEVPDGVVCDKGWRCLRVAGAMPFTAVGVLASLTAPLAASGTSVFATSTFDTDYLFVKETEFEKAITVLRASGHIVD